MFSISYAGMFVFITAVWILARAFSAYKNKGADWKREAELLLVYICLVVIARVVYFPWHLVDGRIEPLRFDAGRILPFRLNLRPFTFLRDVYDGWKRNVIGNIAMFIPVGAIWPVCFKKLDNIWKTVLAGFGFSLLLELSQLLFFERATDVDDVLLNTAGVLTGALVYFGTVKLIRRGKSKKGSDVPGGFPFGDAPDTAVFTCVHVLSGEKPILRVTHDEDGCWQFLCGGGHTGEDARIISLSEAYGLDSSVGALADMEPGRAAVRTDAGAEWTPD